MSLRVTVLGSGISMGIPIIGCHCPACTSQDPHDRRLRTSLLLQADTGESLCFDVGPDFRQQMLAARCERLDALLLTHEHSDHIAGLDDIRPFSLLSEEGVPLYAEPRVAEAIQARFAYIFVTGPKRYPGAPKVDVRLLEDPFAPFPVGSLEVQPLRVMHGRLPILGFRVGRFAYITDCSHIPEATFGQLEGLDLLVINALRHAPHPSHFSLSESLEAIARISPRRALLTHLSHEMGPARSVESLLPEGVELAWDGRVEVVG